MRKLLIWLSVICLLMSAPVSCALTATIGEATPSDAPLRLKCKASALNVREQPGTDQTILGQISRGDIVTVLEMGEGWYLIEAEGLTGWVSAQYLAEIQPEDYGDGELLGINLPVGEAVAKNSFTLFASYTGSANAGDFEKDTPVSVLSRRNGRYQVKFDGGEGWVNVKNFDVEYFDELVLRDGFMYLAIDDATRARIDGLSYKKDCTVPYSELRLIRVLYYDFDGNMREGEIMSNVAAAKDLLIIFHELYLEEYAFGEVSLVDEYGADDRASMSANNTSCFNFRRMSGSGKLSNHAYGIAIDINPLLNPYVLGDKYSPSNAGAYVNRNRNFEGKIDKYDECHKLFVDFGWTWGGEWKNEKDYQHFEKTM